MTPVFERPNVDRVLAQLKDFQRRTVDYVFERLYTDSDRTHRFLVADEVGLGKTLIARGVVARTIDHLWDSIGRIDVVYICSSGDIARQNVNRLNITGRKDWALASRVTLLPTQLKDIQKRKVNFVAFTPGTTFKLTAASGQMNERVLMYWLLKGAWTLKDTGAKNLLQGYVEDHERFRAELRRFDRTSVDSSLERKFHEAVNAHDEAASRVGRPRLRDRFDELCELFGRARVHVPREHRRAQNAIIGELRSLLASTCIRALEPDLVILDEFQRFKDLLTMDDQGEAAEEARLARELFNYAEGAEKTRILLLSATPYKMYTTADEAGGDDHYADFLQTLRFLHDDSARTERVATLLNEYRRGLYRLGDGGGALSELRDRLAHELRTVMERTERLAASPDRNGMLREIPANDLSLQPGDVLAYRSLQQLARKIDHPDIVEYWKAAPYLLSFMDKYKFKEALERAIQSDDGDATDPELLEMIAGARTLFLPDRLLRGRAPAEPPHPSMRWLMDTCLSDGNWRLLWMPPTMPYYSPAGVFAAASAAAPTKRLIFSAWQVAPKAIAALLSYEVERRMFDGAGEGKESLASIRDRHVPLLRFSRDEDRLTGMPVLGLLYPSFVLAELGDPYPIALERGGLGVLNANAMISAIEERIAPVLAPVLERHAAKEGPADESWYWAAPLLMDARSSRRVAESWLARSGAASLWSGEGDDEEEFASSDDAEEGPWADHVAQARAVLLGDIALGRPPEDLVHILAQMALAGPSVAALRALNRVTIGPSGLRDEIARTGAAQIAWSVRNLFNLPEVIALVRQLNGGEPYWRRVLEYAVDGNLQSVLDEYCHVLRDYLGLLDRSSEDVLQEIPTTIRSAIGLRTAAVGVDELRRASNTGVIAFRKHRLRARFAVRFGDETDAEGQRAHRKDRARDAFNSPFWPFVLATTSVGQEGLDFHLYCHSVVHWNLPYNPVDLEQREGRVHRFKGHAVRKNVAARHAAAAAAHSDPWHAVFEHARANREPKASDLVPYWVYPIEGGAVIERHVPALPLSRDAQRLQTLRRALAVYRMVFGQPRQDELLEYLMSQLTAEEAVARLDEVRIDLAPR